MNTNNPDYQAYNQNNQGYNSGQSDSDQIFMLISIGAWLLILITGWICFAVPDIDIGTDFDVLIVWNYVIYATNRGAVYFPLLIHYVLFYMVLIITLLCLTAAFIVYAYHLFMKKDANVINGMLGNLAKFHFIPLASVSALFIIGETLDQDSEVKGAHCFFNIFFTLIGLASLIFIYMQTKLESPSYAGWTIKNGAYGCLIAFLVHNLGYGITFYGEYLILDKDKNPEKWLKGCYIAFSILIGLGNIGISLFLKELVIGVINLLIYIGMTVQYFKMDKEVRKEYTVAPAIIDIFMIVFSMLVTAFLFMKKRGNQ